LQPTFGDQLLATSPTFNYGRGKPFWVQVGMIRNNNLQIGC